MARDEKTRLIGYVKGDGPRADLTDWHGKKIGEGVRKSCWRTPRSYVSSTMCQYEFIVDGVRYTGRSPGNGMYFTGKRKSKRR